MCYQSKKTAFQFKSKIKHANNLKVKRTTNNETKAYRTSIKKKKQFRVAYDTCTVFYLSHIFRMLICFSVTCDLLTVEDLLIHETS